MSPDMSVHIQHESMGGGSTMHVYFLMSVLIDRLGYTEGKIAMAISNSR